MTDKDKREDRETLPVLPRPAPIPPANCGRCGEPSTVLGWCRKCRKTTSGVYEVPEPVRCGEFLTSDGDDVVVEMDRNGVLEIGVRSDWSDFEMSFALNGAEQDTLLDILITAAKRRAAMGFQ